MGRSNLIKTPTILLNEDQVRANIEKMAKKAFTQGVRFRPHFKTHQSAEIGCWFKEINVDAITVSSVRMAQYFAKNGWEDITIAFPVNLREMEEIRKLSHQIKLGLLVDHWDVAKVLAQDKAIRADVWIKIDTGMIRAGVDWQNEQQQLELARLIQGSTHLRFRGLLTHAGQTYHAESPLEIQALYKQSVERINMCRRFLSHEINSFIEVSVGDTPGCWLADEFGDVDEVRPGNFVFFDAMMFRLGVCSMRDISLCVACPVISKYETRNEVLVLGGSVHLSKEAVENSQPPMYGYAVMSPANSDWQIEETNFIRSLSQEHGIVRLDPRTFKQIQIGDLVYVIPAHSCLAVSALGEYLTTDGKYIKAGVIV